MPFPRFEKISRDREGRFYAHKARDTRHLFMSLLLNQKAPDGSLFRKPYSSSLFAKNAKKAVAYTSKILQVEVEAQQNKVGKTTSIPDCFQWSFSAATGFTCSEPPAPDPCWTWRFTAKISSRKIFSMQSGESQMPA
ncbi:hypothetical protein U1Q18_028021 [Sarracenia purpurea var. burkii]